MGKVFNQGQLYTRTLDGDLEEIFYPDEGDVEEGYTSFHTQRIARFTDGESGHPYFSGSTDYAQDGEESGSGIKVNFHRTTTAHLRLLFRTWDSPLTISSWLAALENDHTLTKSELQRVQRIAAPYM